MNLVQQMQQWILRDVACPISLLVMPVSPSPAQMVASNGGPSLSFLRQEILERQLCTLSVQILCYRSGRATLAQGSNACMIALKCAVTPRCSQERANTCFTHMVSHTILNTLLETLNVSQNTSKYDHFTPKTSLTRTQHKACEPGVLRV